MGYIRGYRVYLGPIIGSNLLTALFTLLSIPMIAPFLEILFQQVDPVDAPQGPLQWTFASVEQHLYYQFSRFVEEQGRERALLYVCAAIVITFFGKNLFRYLAMFFMAPLRNGIIRDLRQQLFEKTTSLPIGQFSEDRKGDIISRSTADVQEVEYSILNVLETVFRDPLIIIGALAYMLFVSVNLTIFVFFLLIFTAIVIGGVSKTLKKPSAIVQATMGEMVSNLEEALSGIRIIKGFNAEPYQEAKFGEVNDRYRQTLTGVLRRRDLASPLSEFLGISVVAALLWYGSRQVFSDNLEAATFLTFIFAFYSVIEPTKAFSRAYYNIQKGIAALERIEAILDLPDTIKEQPGARTITAFSKVIRYENVSFAYRETDGPVLRHINLDIPQGKVIALVGASGAGKSTLVDLLPRFYDVTGGRITIDGMDVRDLRIRDLRDLMGIVSQEPILFNDTVYHNIAFGWAHATPEGVEQAARIANAHQFIVNLEQGYQTNIGDRGNKLSGGQRQRLTIARAVLRNPPILILDEATSALDSESEKLVQESLERLMQNRTSIVIAHRLSTIQHADEIVVLRDGQIIEQGSPGELHDRAGEYRKLLELQGTRS